MSHRMSAQDKHQHGEVALTCLTRHQKEEERLILAGLGFFDPSQSLSISSHLICLVTMAVLLFPSTVSLFVNSHFVP